MAQGDVLDFNSFAENLGNSLFDLSGDVFKMGIVDNTIVPTQIAVDSRWGAGGTVNFATNEVTPGGNYAAGGPSLSAVITDNWTSSAGVHTFDGDDVNIAQNAANPSGAFWGIIYDDTDAGKRCLAYVDLGGPIDLSAGLFTITWNANGIIQIV